VKFLMDAAIMLLVSLLVWSVIAAITATAANSVLPNETVLPLAAAVGFVVAGGLLILWIMGRRASNREATRRDADIQIVADFGGLFEQHFPVGFIYDESELPHQKGKILSAHLRLIKGGDDEFLSAACVTMAPNLSVFQPGVGKKPVVTFDGIINKIANFDEIGDQASLIANHKKSVFELNAEREAKEILDSIEKALGLGTKS